MNLVCRPTTNLSQFNSINLKIELSWSAPVPNGGQQRKYRVRYYDPRFVESSPEIVSSTSHVLTSLTMEGKYLVFVEVLDSELFKTSCYIDTRERCECLVSFMYRSMHQLSLSLSLSLSLFLYVL